MVLLEISRDVLLQPLQTVSGIVEKRHTLPILSNVLIEQKDDVLSILASDMEIQIRVNVAKNQPGQDFAVTVSARKILDICRALTSEASLKLESVDHQLQIRAQKSRFSLQTLPAEDFPVIKPPEQAESSFELSQANLRKLILRVHYAMAQQDIRYYLNGMLLVLENQQITVVATDGHRLCLATMAVPQNFQHKEVIIPRKTVNELIKMLASEDDPVRIHLYDNQIGFDIGQVELISKVIDGKFPDYHRVIPTTHQNLLAINRITMQQSLQRAAILSNEKFRGVRLVLSLNEMKVICNNNEQEEAQEEIEVEYRGDALDIGFNVSYLLDALNQLDSDVVECHFGDANSSMLMTIPDDPGYKYVIMPMRI